MNTSDVLYRAADLIEERGWTRGVEAWHGFTDDDNAPLCLEGAIMAALGIKNGQRPLIYRGCAAYDAVARYVDFPESPWNQMAPWPLELWKWNDDQSRDDAEVIGVLRAAAVVEAARESQPAEQVTANV